VAFVAGLLTTMTGVGGSVVFIALMTFLLPPQTVLVVSAPVLMVGNISRVALFRNSIQTTTLGWFLAGGVPAAAVAGLMLQYIPHLALRLVIGIFMLGYVGQKLVARTWHPKPLPNRAFLAVGVAAGVASATVGSSAPFFAPFFQSRILTKQQFVGTIAGGTAGLSAAKLAGYAGAGLLTKSLVPVVAVSAAGMAAGTLAGRYLLDRVSEQAFARIVLAAIGFSGIRLLLDI
jgi:uncharacterized membrane protein YfcA